MAQSALDAAGVRRVGYGLEVGRSVRTAGGVGAYCVATRTACYCTDLPFYVQFVISVFCVVRVLYVFMLIYLTLNK